MSKDSKTYWAERAARQMYREVKATEETTKYLKDVYKRAAKQLNKDAEAILNTLSNSVEISAEDCYKLLKTMKDPTDLTELVKRLEKLGYIDSGQVRSVRARLSRLQNLYGEIGRTMTELAEITTAETAEIATAISSETYLYSVYETACMTGLGLTARPPSAKMIKRLLETPWSNSEFSERIWSNTKQLEKELKKELLVSALTGRTRFKTALEIDQKFRKGLFNARRIVRTESAHAAAQMRLQAYEDYEIKKYIYVAILDLKTSEICRELDAKIFDVEDAKTGENYPPMHPFCRSTTVSFIDDKTLDALKRKARNPVTGEIQEMPARTSYKEWYKQFVQPEIDKQKDALKTVKK